MKPDDPKRISDAPTIGASRSPGAAAARRAVSTTGNILEVGQVLGGRFEIQEMLGIGGMGAVYKAYDRDIDRVIALKCIRPELAKDPEITQRFTQELLLARQIAHKNVIRIFDVRDSGGLKFITMEYVDGRDLSSMVEAKGKLTSAESVAIMMQVCSGLACAHAEGVVHRDLKPSNIMVEPQGRVVVMDFGLARADSTGQMTQTGAVMGTYQYMSPEQAKGTKADARSDIFTVGIILYELLTGKTPYAADSALASLLKRTQEQAVPPSQIDPAIPRALSAIVARCLERDVAKRYQAAEDLFNDLRAFQGGSTVSPASARVGKQMMWVTASFVLAGLITIAAIVKWSSLSHGGSATVTHPTVKVLLADFQNNTADSVFDGTLESSFALAMEGAPFISAYNRTQARKTLGTIDPAANVLNEAGASLVALREGVNVVISGAVEKLGNGYKISCKAVDPVSSKVLGSAETETDAKSGVLQAVTQLADKMRRMLGDTTPDSARRQQEETVTSSSLEAVHEYAVAQDLQFSGKWEEALPHYSNAVALDPNMGRAYAGMAVMSANMGRKSDADTYYQKAMTHLDRMSDREKYRTRGGYYLMTRQPDKAIQEYNALVEQYPADAVGPSNLALSYFFTRDMPKAMEQGKRAVELSPKALLQRNNLALYSIYAGDYPAGEKAAQDVLQQNPAYADALGALGIAQTGEGHFTAATATYQKLAALSPRGASMATMGLADIAELQGRTTEAISLLEKGIAADLGAKDSAGAAAKTIALGQAYLAQPDKKKALVAADSAVKLDSQPSVLMAAGELYVNGGDTPRATKLVAQLSAKIEPEPQLYGALLQGSIALSRGQKMEAVQSFEKAQKISNSWLGHFYLGKAYLQNGSFTEADSEFELCLKRRGEASAVFLDDVPTLRLVPQVYYFLARAQEGLKSPAAADTYRTFLKMQPEGSSELTTDARRRVQAH
jgi:serine/threonine protein kinase/tetratricopeptide (TPR) repeat protein